MLAVCAEERVAVVPFGGGTSIVGGLAPLRGAPACGDLARPRRASPGCSRSTAPSLTVSVAAGTRAPVLEAWLAEHDLTLGHYPDSFEFASIGGCAATRSVGQASSGYGRIDQAVQGVRLATPRGELSSAALPASAAGPALRELLVGSEGVLGVITGLLLRVRMRPARHRYEGVVFDDFDDRRRGDAHRGAGPRDARRRAALRRAADEPAAGGGRVGRPPRAARAPVPAQPPRRAGDRRLGGAARRGRPPAPAHDDAAAPGGGDAIGETAGRAWSATRFAPPYVRDELLDRGVLVDQFETATTWTGLEALRAAVTAAIANALAARGTPRAGRLPDLARLPHRRLAHLHRARARPARRGGGAVACRQGRRERDDHRRPARRSPTTTASAATTRTGSARSSARSASSSLAALKAHLDPTGVMNPGKLIPAL